MNSNIGPQKQPFSVNQIQAQTKAVIKEMSESENELKLTLENTKVVFGLVAQGHIPKIESMLKEGKEWIEIGKAISRCPVTAKDYYERYLNKDNKMENEKTEEKNITNQMKDNLNGKRIAISFDTTGSMRPAIEQVQQKLRDLVEMMSADIPDLKIGLIAHGDYCDGDKCITFIDFTDDLEKIMSFINNAPPTSGGDAPECYEYALQTARQMSWTEEGGSVILIGDERPHEENPNNIKWRDEVQKMLEMNVKVFPLQCLYSVHNTAANKFWEEVSQISQTPLLMLESFGDSANALEAVAYASSGGAVYEHYKAKFATEVSMGARACATSNFVDIQEKLDLYSKSPKSE